MALISWQDSFSVGVDTLDDDHRLLIELINQLFDAKETGQARDVVGSCLNVLIEYTETHFAREERLMQVAQYPMLVQHHAEHEKLTRQVREIQKRYSEGEHNALDEEVMTFLKNWLAGHILGVDKQYKPHVEKVDVDQVDLTEVYFDAQQDAFH